MRAAVILAALLAPVLAAQHWKIQYFYDDARKVLHFADIAFPSPERGVAVGVIIDEIDRRGYDPVSMVTNDGGQTWSRVDLDQAPVSLFFLDETLGWLVTDRGLWITEEAGRSWRRISKHDEFSITRVWFLDRMHGFAVGPEKAAFQTHDGGETWDPIPEAAKPAGDPDYTDYTHVAFADKQRGLIVGSSTPPGPRGAIRLKPGEYPEAALRRRLNPTLTLELQTLDGGQTWSSSTAPLFGQVASLKLDRNEALILFVFNQIFEYPSEVYRIDLNGGKSSSAFRRKDLRVSDVALFPGPRAFVAGVETPGELPVPPTPTPLHILSSNGTPLSPDRWSEMEVDYRAVARLVTFAGPDADHQWLATDTGMILHLEP